jgi:hypothetical protein
MLIGDEATEEIVPIVLAYTITIYCAFGGKVVLTKESY